MTLSQSRNGRARVSKSKVESNLVTQFPQAPVMPGPNWANLELLTSSNFLAHGSVEILDIASSSLRGNALNDPAHRPLLVYVPDHLGGSPNKRYPVIYLLHGAMTDVGAWLKKGDGRQSLIETVDSIIADEGDAIVVMIDAWTSVGGSQYLNSGAIGRYQDYLVDDVVAWVDIAFPTISSPLGRAILGHSSGGFGAWMACTRRPGIFGVLGMLAADCLFEGVYLQTLAPAVRRLRESYQGLMDYFWSTHRPSDHTIQSYSRDFQLQVGQGRHWNTEDAPIYDQHMLAAAFSGIKLGKGRYLFSQITGEIDADVWQSWLRFDPVRTAADFKSELLQLRNISIAAGKQDEFFSDNGAAALSGVLTSIGVRNTHLTADGSHEPGKLFADQFRAVLQSVLSL